MMFEKFLNHFQQLGRADKTIQNYETAWKAFEKWIRETDPTITDPVYATQKDISDYKRYMLKFGGRNGGPAKPSTMQLYFVQLNAIFKYFAKQGYIPDNPVGPIKKPPAARRFPKWLSKNEQNALLRELRDNRLSEAKRDNAIVVTMLRMGLRVHELCDLKREDLTMSERKGTAYIHGKGDKDREVPVNADVRTAIQAYLQERKDSIPYVFLSQRSAKISVRAVQHIIAKYRNRTGIKHLTCHSLRHSFGHDLVMKDVDLQRVATLMGHFKEDGSPNIEMTMIYTTPGVEDLEAAVESISWT
ncbi:tyrosine-type recombinase/integrase [Paenibacillus polymyxa]|uniref:tyrosine-type recombinase/integrase n=1 Tax=Paenibacillus polymyxa TaxID=1406 RepID=UPI0032AF369C